ncbi:MAG: dihydropteroate synthase [Chloroflexota bacterium]|nr:dihydropteroate synthase [Chloroflexota bacterium]
MTEAQHPQSVGLTVDHPTVMVLRKVRPLVRGVLDVPPESFSKGGRFLGPGLAITHGMELASQRADVIDIGGESRRPGAESPTVVVEPNRAVLVVLGLARLTDGPLPIDISRREVMREASRAVGSMINDVRALLTPGAVDAVAELGAPVCSTHMQGEPRAMQRSPRHRNAVVEVRSSIADRMRAGEPAGVNRKLMPIGSGLGCGKTFARPDALRRAAQSTGLRAHIMVAILQMGVLEALTGRSVKQRVAGSVAAALISTKHGAIVVRAHDRVSQRMASAFLACDRQEWT